MLSNAASSIWRSAIEGALAKDDTGPAIALHQLAGDSIAPADAAILDRYVDGARERETGRNYLATIAVPEADPSAPLDVAKSLADLDAAHTAATAQNEAEWLDNPSQRATNQHFIDVAFGRKKRDTVQTRADLLQNVDDWLNKSGQIQRPPTAIWTRLNRDEQEAIDSALAQNVDLGLSQRQPVVAPQDIILPVSSDPASDAALADCRELCAEKFEGGLLLGWAGIPASDQPSMMRVCIRDCMLEKGFHY
jgi:hypothetical protein